MCVFILQYKHNIIGLTIKLHLSLEIGFAMAFPLKIGICSNWGTDSKSIKTKCINCGVRVECHAHLMLE